MSDSFPIPDEEQDLATTRCPIPDWALRPLAILSPLLALAAIAWFVLR